MKSSASFALILFSLLVCGAAFAQGGPPLRTDDPETPGNRQWEINVGATMERASGFTGMELPIADFNYGLGSRIQLKFEIPLLLQFGGGQMMSEAGDSKLGVKWRFVDQERHGINLSTYPQFSFNSPGPQRLADKGNQFLLPLEISRSFGKFTLDAECGYNFRQYQRDQLLFGLAAGYEATPRFELLAELNSLALTGLAENESVFQLGGRRKLNEKYVLLFAAGRALPGSTARQPAFVGYVGLQLLLGAKSGR